MELGMRLLESKQKLEPEFLNHYTLYWQRVKKFWGLWPEYWEDLIVRGIRQGLEGTGRETSASFLKFVEASKIKMNRTWDALRLLCLHSPRGKTDIDIVDDIKLLEGQKWSFRLFEKLPVAKAIQLLKLVLSDKTDSNFLTDTPTNSILDLQTLKHGHSFNAILYQTMLQISMLDPVQQSKGCQKAVETYKDLKRQSESSREQPDRASYARAAGLYAIASGSLEFYAAHVKWLARFVSDPLTLEVVFSKNAIASREAVELLSGFPHTVSETTTLSEVSEKVFKANAILLQFREHQKAAFRQPSCQYYDWDALRTLQHGILNTRIRRGTRLQGIINVSQAELYGQIWGQNLDLFLEFWFRPMSKV